MGRRSKNKLVYDPFVVEVHAMTDRPDKNVLICLGPEDNRTFARMVMDSCKVDLSARGIAVAVLGQAYAPDQYANEEIGDDFGGLMIESYGKIGGLAKVGVVYANYKEGGPLPKPEIPKISATRSPATAYLRTACFPACLVGRKRDQDGLPEEGTADLLFDGEGRGRHIAEFLAARMGVEKGNVLGLRFVADEDVLDAALSFQMSLRQAQDVKEAKTLAEAHAATVMSIALYGCDDESVEHLSITIQNPVTYEPIKHYVYEGLLDVDRDSGFIAEMCAAWKVKNIFEIGSKALPEERCECCGELVVSFYTPQGNHDLPHEHPLLEEN